MKKVKLIALVVVMLMVNLIVMTVTSKAAGDTFSCTVSMNPSTNKIKGGDTVKIDVIINDIDLSDGTDGVTTIEADLEYDQEIFETVRTSNISYDMDHKSLSFVSGSHIYIINVDNDGIIKQNGTIAFSINMTVKENAQFDTTEVKLKKVTATDNNKKHIIDVLSTTFSIDKVVEPSPEPSPVPSAEPSPVPSAKPSSTPSPVPSTTPSATPSTTPSAVPSTKPTTVPSTKPSTKPSSTTSNNSDGASKKLPQTGIENTGIIVAFSASVIGCGILFYKYKKYNNMTK